MRSDLLLMIAVAVFATSFDALTAAPSAERTQGVRLAQTGPLPTSIVNPRLGQPPNDSLLRPNTAAPNAAVVPNDGVGDVPPSDPRGRLGPMNGANRLGVPPPGTAVDPAIGGAPGAPAAPPGAIAPPAGSNVGPAPAAPAMGR